MEEVNMMIHIPMKSILWPNASFKIINLLTLSMKFVSILNTNQKFCGKNQQEAGYLGQLTEFSNMHAWEMNACAC